MNTEIFQPVAALALWTILLVFRLGVLRFQASAKGEVPGSFYVLYNDPSPEPDHVRQATRHYINLFEAPVLFYIAAIVAAITGGVTTSIMGLAWAYVMLRFVHSIIHLGYNNVMHRFYVYVTSMVVLLSIWVLLAQHVY